MIDESRLRGVVARIEGDRLIEAKNSVIKNGKQYRIFRGRYKTYAVREDGRSVDHEVYVIENPKKAWNPDKGKNVRLVLTKETGDSDALT